MNTGQIKSILYADCKLSTSFEGVFPSDKIPKFCDQPTALVCNLDPQKRPGSHWVAIYIKNNVGEYFDSYGLPPMDNNFINFLNNNCRKWKFNRLELQAFNSTVCGHYCIWFLSEKARGKNAWRQFKNEKGRENDKLVVKRVRDRFGNLDLYKNISDDDCQCCTSRQGR
jgi:hypothetical protein